MPWPYHQRPQSERKTTASHTVVTASYHLTRTAYAYSQLTAVTQMGRILLEFHIANDNIASNFNYLQLQMYADICLKLTPS